MIVEIGSFSVDAVDKASFEIGTTERQLVLEGEDECAEYVVVVSGVRGAIEINVVKPYYTDLRITRDNLAQTPTQGRLLRQGIV